MHVSRESVRAREHRIIYRVTDAKILAKVAKEIGPGRFSIFGVSRESVTAKRLGQ